jgi:predicted transcriptional regulator
LETESAEIIEQIKAIFKKDGHDFFDDLPQHVKDSIEAGLKDIDAGDVFEHDEVMHNINIKYGITH